MLLDHSILHDGSDLESPMMAALIEGKLELVFFAI